MNGAVKKEMGGIDFLEEHEYDRAAYLVSNLRMCCLLNCSLC